MDNLFKVRVISRTPNPWQLIYAAAHQDYSDRFVYEELFDHDGNWIGPNEGTCYQSIVKNLLKGGKGHYGPLEHASIVFNVGNFPHSTMQQLRTHRVGVSFDVQSFRYTGSNIYGVVTRDHDIEDVFYFRPVGNYVDRFGKKYTYTQEQRLEDLELCKLCCERYHDRFNQGISEEHARGLIPFDVRQHWVLSVNVRSLMHILDLRWKPNAQLEAQQLCDLLFPHFHSWVPDIATWYHNNRAKKGKLAP